MALTLALACAGAVPPEPVMPSPDLEARLAVLSNRVSARAFAAELPWFAAHADEVTPHLIAALAQDGPYSARAADTLGQLARAEAIPTLAAALDAHSVKTRFAAGLALARIPGSEALAALAGAVAEGTADAAVNALEGLRTRTGDPGVCDAIRPGLGHPDSNVRFYAERAAAARGC